MTSQHKCLRHNTLASSKSIPDALTREQREARQHEWTLAVRTVERSCLHRQGIYIPLYFHPKLPNRIATIHVLDSMISEIPRREFS